MLNAVRVLTQGLVIAGLLWLAAACGSVALARFSDPPFPANPEALLGISNLAWCLLVGWCLLLVMNEPKRPTPAT
jgi:hypothetical protein